MLLLVHHEFMTRIINDFFAVSTRKSCKTLISYNPERSFFMLCCKCEEGIVCFKVEFLTLFMTEMKILEIWFMICDKLK